MKKGFSTVMSAQFFSSLADNAILVAAVELLRTSNAPAWQVPALAPLFALFYVVLAPFVGAFADALPKGRVMFIANAIKIVGCLMMLVGVHPLVAFTVIGLGAAAYGPAKYGIVTELLPPSLLVKGNGWIEGLTIASIILGILMGGLLIGPFVAPVLLSPALPLVHVGIDTPATAAIVVIVLPYAIAAAINLRVPRTAAPLQPMPPWRALVTDFARCNSRLWNDKLGQISLATTSLLWGIFGNLRLIMFAWAAAALGYGTAQASNLAGVVVFGSILGAVVAAATMKLDRATAVIPLAIGVGFLMIGLVFISSLWQAVPFLVVMGAICGFLVVPMNALLQHRGHNLMGAGRSIAVQNFNEQACILALGAFYVGMTRFGVSAFAAITVFGLLVAAAMEAIRRWHRHNTVAHADELERLLALARTDRHH